MKNINQKLEKDQQESEKIDKKTVTSELPAEENETILMEQSVEDLKTDAIDFDKIQESGKPKGKKEIKLMEKKVKKSEKKVDKLKVEVKKAKKKNLKKSKLKDLKEKLVNALKKLKARIKKLKRANK